ncbi:MAG: CyaA/EF/ExoY family adenylyl cyclase toxin, partial [Alphaproteobacteria bacterium]|nr:CyaA/EF/ExoY family adenylyl cyclase toxin [Alphaproteobacteria bacterium]
MPENHNFSQTERLTGMLDTHLLASADLCLANNTIMVFRPINPTAKLRFLSGCVGKGLDIKGKSADQGVYLEGLVPTDSGFSKLGTQNNHEAIEEYNKINQSKHVSDRGRYNEIINTDISSLTDTELSRFKDSLTNITESMPLKNERSEQIYGFKDSKGHTLKDSKGNMVFATKNPDGKYILEGSKKEFKLPKECTEKAIEVIGYRNLEVKDGKIIEKPSTPVTADYDQLFIGTKAKNDGPNEIMPGNPNAGYATDIGHAVTVALAVDTKDKHAITHNAETGNPCPEDIADGNYVVFEPSENLKQRVLAHIKQGRKTDELLKSCIKILHTEQEIIRFYNKKEKEGYNIPINNMWGWQRNKKGELEINPDRISAQTLDMEINKLKGTNPYEEALVLREEYITLNKLKYPNLW